MRLLRVNALDLELVEFQADPPPYAILSHRWEAEEFLYTDLGTKTALQKAGFAKIHGALEQAKKDGLEYLWADTCCIDKANNTELSEAINSMYRWYKQAIKCYAYLSDIEDLDGLADSMWFKRGWTLQELLAPQDLVFFSQDWNPVGAKAELVETLSATTGIDRAILQGTSPITAASIAQRMSWVSKRTTTRTEDIAYCLLGIFDVNMPLIYGEGEKAFIRLQEQIANDSDDHTLFAWTDPDADDTAENGLLAKQPSHFMNSGSYVACYDPQSSEPYSINKKRLKIEVRLVRNDYDLRRLLPDDERRGQGPRPSCLASLSCTRIETDTTHLTTIAIRQIGGVRGQFHRTRCSQLFHLPCGGVLTSIVIPQTLSDVPADRMVRPPNYFIELGCIYKDFSIRVELIDYAYHRLLSFGDQPAQQRSKLYRRLPLRGAEIECYGQSIPNDIALTLTLGLGHFSDIFKPVHKAKILCGMTADLKLGFQVLHNLDTPERPLIAWDGKTPVKTSIWFSYGRVHNFEFVPRKYLHGYRFDMRITSSDFISRRARLRLKLGW